MSNLVKIPRKYFKQTDNFVLIICFSKIYEFSKHVKNFKTVKQSNFVHQTKWRSFGVDYLIFEKLRIKIRINQNFSRKVSNLVKLPWILYFKQIFFEHVKISAKMSQILLKYFELWTSNKFRSLLIIWFSKTYNFFEKRCRTFLAYV